MEKLNEMQKTIVTENIKLVYYAVNKLGVNPNSNEYEDLISVGTIGLIWAAKRYEKSKEIAFSTYAVKCIENAVFRWYRKNKKHANNVSINMPISNDKDEQNTLAILLEDTSCNFIEKIEIKEEFCRVLSIILNSIEGRSRVIMLMWLSGKTQNQIAKEFNITRAYVSNIIVQSVEKIKRISDENKQCNEVFNVSVKGEIYTIVTSVANTYDLEFNFSKWLEKAEFVGNVSGLKVKYNENKLIIQTPIHQYSFYLMAQIIRKIDEYSFACIRNSLCYKDESGDNEAVFANSNMVYVQPSKLVRDYMLSLERFNKSKLVSHFKDIKETVISSQIRIAKNKGLISRTSVRGEYIVNKE